MIKSNTLKNRGILINFIRSYLNNNRDFPSFLENSKLNWDSIFILSLKEGIAPIIYKIFFNSEYLKCIPKYHLDLFKKVYLETYSINQYLSNILKEFSFRLSKKDLKVIVFKGIPILELYEDIALRPMEDIDLLIRSEDIDQISDILKEMGFYNDDIYPLTYKKGIIKIDLHTDPFSADRIGKRKDLVNLSLNDIFREAKPFLNGDSSILKPSIYHLIILQSYHILKHSFNRLIWYIDMIKIFNGYSPSINWTAFYNLCKKIGSDRAVYYSFIIPAKTFDITCMSFIDKIFSFSPSIIERFIINKISKGYNLGRIPQLLYLYQFNTLIDKIQFFWENTLPNKNIILQGNPQYKYKSNLYLIFNRFSYITKILFEDIRKVFMMKI